MAKQSGVVSSLKHEHDDLIMGISGEQMLNYGEKQEMLIMSHRHNGTEDLLIKKADSKALSISVASRVMRGGS